MDMTGWTAGHDTVRAAGRKTEGPDANFKKNGKTEKMGSWWYNGLDPTLRFLTISEYLFSMNNKYL